jgi:hypothetical protein
MQPLSRRFAQQRRRPAPRCRAADRCALERCRGSTAPFTRYSSSAVPPYRSAACPGCAVRASASRGFLVGTDRRDRRAGRPLPGRSRIPGEPPVEVGGRSTCARPRRYSRPHLGVIRRDEPECARATHRTRAMSLPGPPDPAAHSQRSRIPSTAGKLVGHAAPPTATERRFKASVAAAATGAWACGAVGRRTGALDRGGRGGGFVAPSRRPTRAGPSCRAGPA